MNYSETSSIHLTQIKQVKKQLEKKWFTKHDCPCSTEADLKLLDNEKKDATVYFQITIEKRRDLKHNTLGIFER